MNRIHCSYHKCLTFYFSKTMTALYNMALPWSKGYQHHASRIDEFYANVGKLDVQSLNNHMPDFEKLGDFRMTRFVRDPRDLVVSGYFFHRRGAERWCNVVDPTPGDWANVNGNIPEGMEEGDSLATYLQRVPEEEGLIAEIEFRRHHFESMMKWPDEDRRVLLFKYEEVVGNEPAVFSRIFEWYRLPWHHRAIGMRFVDRFRASRQEGHHHVRNPKPNQWQDQFTPEVTDYFNDRYGPLLDKLGYPA